MRAWWQVAARQCEHAPIGETCVGAWHVREIHYTEARRLAEGDGHMAEVYTGVVQGVSPCPGYQQRRARQKREQTQGKRQPKQLALAEGV